jgi:carboxypeptidase Taq
MTQAWDQLVPRLQELTDLDSATSLLSWDQAVLMPPKGAASRARTMATLESLAHTRLTDPAIGELLSELAGEDGLQEHQMATVRVLTREYERATKVPDKLVKEIAETTALAYQVWTEAKPASDFAVFQPHLERIVELKKEQADAIGYEKERYDALLDIYEPGMTSTEIEAMFSQLTRELQPVVDAVLGVPHEKPAFLTADYSDTVKDQLCQWVVRELGFDTEAGRLDTSPHPFTAGIAAGDVRQTTRYADTELTGSLYAAIHETGHALYEQGLPREWSDLPAGQVPSLGLHESQSRMWENQVGRNRSFTDFLLPRLKELFETELGTVTPEEFHKGVNHPERTLIRVEADELTYNLHIALRFELELALFRDELAVSDLPAAWDEAMDKHLGLRPGDHAEGVLQDMHWAIGIHGYFPTYSLGTLYAAAFYAKAEGDLGGLDEDFRRGDTSRLLEWLRSSIHSKGSLYDAKDLAERVLGEPLSVTPFVTYMKDKYRELYDLNI